MTKNEIIDEFYNNICREVSIQTGVTVAELSTSLLAECMRSAYSRIDEYIKLNYPNFLNETPKLTMSLTLPPSHDTEAVKKIIQPPSKCPLMLWAFPGVGKTAWCEDAAKTVGLPFYRVCPAEQSPDEVGGVCAPDPTDPETCVRLLPKWWVLACRKPWFILIDEVTAASEDQLIAVMRATDNEREMGGMKLHPDSVIVLCANPPECAAGRAREMPLPLLSRVRHFQMSEMTAIDWMMGQGGMVATVGSYLRANPEAALATAEVLKKSYASQQPFPCPRSWTRAAMDCGHDANAYGAYVGADAAAGLAAFLAAGDLPDPGEILKGNTFHIPKRGDAVLATGAALCRSMNLLTEQGPNRDLTQEWLNWGAWFMKASAKGHAGHLCGEVVDCIQKNHPPCMAQLAPMIKPYAEALKAGRGQATRGRSLDEAAQDLMARKQAILAAQNAATTPNQQIAVPNASYWASLLGY